MSAQYSIDMRNAMLQALADALTDGVLRIYSNSTPPPASVNDALPGGAVLLAEISDNNTGDGLVFSAPVNGVMSKDPSQIWSGAAVASGTAGWFRHVLPTDDGSASTAPRIQGTVGLSGADLNLAEIEFEESEIYTVTRYNISQPAQA